MDKRGSGGQFAGRPGPKQRSGPPVTGRALRGAGMALALALIASLGLGLTGGGDAAAQDGVAKAEEKPAAIGGQLGAGTVTSDPDTRAADDDAPAEGGEGGDGDAGSAPAEAIEVNPADISADSLISRHQAAPRDPNRGPVTNLPLPRYVSLKGGEGNARRGPSLSHRIDWVFRHPGMPLRVVAEFGHWRRVEDQDGAGGWVHYSLLSGVRTAIVMTDMAELRSRADQNATVIARAEAGAIVRLHECNAEWCRVSGGGEKGWVPKTSLWGVDPGELRN